jgi:type II restriction enzyme
MSDLLERLLAAVTDLPASKQLVLEPLVQALGVPFSYRRFPSSDLADESFCELMGATLQLHHATSREAFTKDKFEYALERVLNQLGRHARLATRGNPGEDIEVDGETWSLKTQADRSISAELITISKFMELGRGEWEDEADLIALRERMFEHMKAYERIFTLRCLTPADETTRVYQLVEIPKSLLLLARDFPCEMSTTSRQNPKPGYCRVRPQEHLLFQLYFDGGTERKLQIQKLRVDECVVHVMWQISLESLAADNQSGL